jgi:hypothetical protein
MYDSADLMHISIDDFERLVAGFSRMFDNLGIRTSAGRVMLAFEVIYGVFILIAFAALLGHEIILAILSLIRPTIAQNRSENYLLTIAAFMALSLVFVFIREMAGKAGRTRF